MPNDPRQSKAVKDLFERLKDLECDQLLKELRSVKDEDTIGWARYYFMGPNIAPISGNLASRAGDRSPCAISIRRLTAFSILSRDAVKEDVAARRACLVCELCHQPARFSALRRLDTHKTKMQSCQSRREGPVAATFQPPGYWAACFLHEPGQDLQRG